MITFEDIKNNQEIKAYVNKADGLLGVLGYTDHSAAHTMKVAETAASILKTLEYSEREVELVRIAGYIHDIGNMVNRVAHEQTGALLAFNILTRIGMEPAEIADIVCAIGNHDERTGIAVSPLSAAIIIGDKIDVRRTRVRNDDFATFDIHDRVNYAVEEARLAVSNEERTILLKLKIDTQICSVIDYFEIFLARMLMCKRAAEFLDTRFQLIVNEAKLL